MIAGHTKPPLILVVDDDVTTVATIKAILVKAGFRTATAGDVAGALASIHELKPDLILLDVGLPDGSGLDVCRKIHEDSPFSRTPVLFISATEDVSTKVQGFEAGAVDYLTKPVAGAEVLARARTHLRLKEAYEKLAELQAERVQRLATAQQNLMPQPSDFPEARFQVNLRQVLNAGGDFYDVISAGEGLVDYIVADASGHDLAASLWTAALKALAAEYASPVHLPLEILRMMNSALCRILPPGAFFTIVYTRLNHQNGRASIISAGHPPAILVPASGEEPVILSMEGDVVGAFPDAMFGIAEVGLKPGDRLFLYSDGLIEAGGPAQSGTARLAEACFTSRHLPLENAIRAAVEEMTAGACVEDDTLLLGIER